MNGIDFKKIEKKWQSRWEKNKIFESKENKKNKFYVLEMYPYPSGGGLHMGHSRNYTIGDTYARFKRMRGFNVLYPMGFDSFGLPAENAAIKNKSHPKKFTEDAIKSFIIQQKALGLSYDWSRMIKSHSPDYYKWDQWIFLKMFEKGLVYRKKAPVNFCKKCNTVLANEQVHDGKCWRHKDVNVEVKHLEQWFFRITKYAEELYDFIDELKEWPEDVKTMQKNWIGKSYGTEIDFEIDGKKWKIFTTRPDTIFGVTFMVISSQHSRLMDLVKDKQKKEVEIFLKKIRSTSDKDVLEKEGIFTGSYAINPMNKERIPIYIGNFVVADYGSGMVMAVPAHDQRDFEFAKKYGIKIKLVVKPNYSLNAEKMSRAYVEDGVLINSNEFNGMNNKDAIEEITKYLEKKKLGKKTVQYRLKDWLISRQRFWGTPIPIIYCDKCGIVPEKDLPVLLPDNIKFTSEKNPLVDYKNFVNVKCPKCKGNGRRETDTMDTFVNSSWYFLRYCDSKNNKEIFNKEKVEYWMPVDVYVGGKEHACMHLIYFRFYTKFLRDLGLFNFDEPVVKLFNQGMVTKGGYVMSKSRGNVVDPLEIINKYGADTLRLFLLFVSGADKDLEWDDRAIDGSFRFLNKFYGLLKLKGKDKSKKIESRLNRLIKEVTEDIEELKYNTALVKIMGFVNYLYKADGDKKEATKNLILLMSVFTPHTCEEMWSKIGKGFVSLQKWPVYDEKKIDLEIEEEDNLIERTFDDIKQVLKLVKIDAKGVVLGVSDEWKYDLIKNIKREFERSRDIKKVINNVMIKGKEKEISNIVLRSSKDLSKLPKIVLDSRREYSILKENLKNFEKDFKLKISLVKDNEKAMPGKPSILIK